MEESTLLVSPHIVECEVSKMNVSSGGLDNYYWPLSNHERTAFGEYLMHAYTTIIREHAPSDSDDILPYKFFGIHFLVQVIAVFQGDLIHERSTQDGMKLDVPENWLFWPDLFKRQTPADPQILAKLKNGPEQSNYKKNVFKLNFLKRAIKLLDFKRTGFQVGGLKVKPITSSVLNNNIIATQRNPLIVEHSKNIDKDVIFCRSNRWFEAVTDEDVQESILLNDKILENKIIKMIDDGYQKYGSSLKPHSLRFIQNLLDQGPACLRVHYKRLLEQPEKLPKNIWTGTTSQYWDSMLRVAVMRNGGFATAHDHGSGWSYLTHPLRGINELWGCNYFVTFNDFHGSEMERLAPKWPHYEIEIPKIKSVGRTSAQDNMVCFDKFKNPNHKTTKIFLMATLYDDDKGRIGPGTPNNFLVDVQAQLLSSLKDLGYEVVFKIHPETKKMPPQEFQDKFDALITKEPFGNMMEEADLVIFPCIYSTAFMQCLETNIPVLLVDFFDFPWTKKGQELIEKRCSIMKAEYKNCRGIVNKDDLDKAIQLAPNKCNNHEFYKTYFG